MIFFQNKNQLNKFKASIFGYSLKRKRLSIFKLVLCLFGSMLVNFNCLSQNEKTCMDSAKAIIERNELIKLERYAERLIKLNSQNPWGYLYMAQSHRAFYSFDSAYFYIEKTLALNPKIAYAHDLIAQMKINKAVTNKKLLKEALTYNTKALELDSGDYRIYNTLGLYSSLISDDKNALKAYNASLRLKQSQPHILSKAGQIKLAQKDTLGAISDFSAALQLNSNLKDVYYERGNIYLRLKRYEESYDDFEKLLLLDREEGIQNRGVSAYYVGKYDVCISDCSECINNNSEYLNYYLLIRGSAYKAIGDMNMASDDWEWSLEQGNLNAFDSLYKYCSNIYNAKDTVQHLYGKGDYQLALDYLERMYRADSNSVYINIMLAKCLSKQEYYSNAVRFFERAISLEPHNDSLLYLCGSNYFDLVDNQNARVKFRSIKNKMAFEPAIKYKWAIMNMDEKNYNCAIDDFKYVLKHDKSLEYNYANQFLANAYFYIKDYKNAIAHCEVVISKGLINGGIYQSLGYIYYTKKKYKAAMLNFNKQLEISPERSESYYYRAMCNYHLNNKETVCSDLLMAKKFGFEPEEKELVDFCK